MIVHLALALGLSAFSFYRMRRLSDEEQVSASRVVRRKNMGPGYFWLLLFLIQSIISLAIVIEGVGPLLTS